MTVKELKEALSEFPDNMVVNIMREDCEDYEGGAFAVESVFSDDEVGALIID